MLEQLSQTDMDRLKNKQIEIINKLQLYERDKIAEDNIIVIEMGYFNSKLEFTLSIFRSQIC